MRSCNLQFKRGGDSVDIIGLFPWQCASRLITLKDERRRDGRSSIQPDAVRYLMPGRNSVLIYRHSGEMGPVVQRWIAGVNGFRHWLRDDTDGNDTSASLTLLEFDALYLECAIHVHRNDGCSVTMLSPSQEMSSPGDYCNPIRSQMGPENESRPARSGRRDGQRLPGGRR